MDTTGLLRTKVKSAQVAVMDCWRVALQFLERHLQLGPLEDSLSELKRAEKRPLFLQTLSGHEGAVKCLCCDQWHLLSGSTDGLVMAWSMVGKYERCLMAYKHPK